MGLGAGGRQSAVALAAAMSGRQERSLKWAQGSLVKAIEAREAALRWELGVWGYWMPCFSFLRCRCLRFPV